MLRMTITGGAVTFVEALMDVFAEFHEALDRNLVCND